jgi:hypothetical protein
MGYSYLQKPYSERGREFQVSPICLRTAVLIALGRTERTYYQGKIVLTEDELRAIDKVWHGNICRPVEKRGKIEKAGIKYKG